MANPDGRPDLAAGDTGDWVTELQQLLQTVGVYLGSCDGDLGERTVVAVHEFALVYHVMEDPDVLVGEEVWTSLLTQAGGLLAAQSDVPAEGQLSDDQAWVWHEGTWQPAEPEYSQPYYEDTSAADAVEHVSEDGHWRWVDGQWQPNR